MNTVLKLDPIISEFDTQEDADSYDAWLQKKIAEARLSTAVSHEEALKHFTAKRAERMRNLKDAAAS